MTSTSLKPRPGRKFCPACNAAHPVEDFARNKASKDGRYRICRKAEAEWRKQRAAAIAAGAPRVIRKGSPGYVAPEAASPAPKAASRKRAAASKATPKAAAPRRSRKDGRKLA